MAVVKLQEQPKANKKAVKRTTSPAVGASASAALPAPKARRNPQGARVAGKKPSSAEKAGQAPAGYVELCEFLPSPSVRARALGVTTNTVTSWDRSAPTRIAVRHQRAVAQMLSAARGLFEVVGSKLLVEQLLVEPQPMFDGVVPARAVRDWGAPWASMYVGAVREMHEIKLRALRSFTGDLANTGRLTEGLDEETAARRRRLASAVDQRRS